MGLGGERQLFEKDTKLYNKVCVWKMERSSHCFHNKTRKKKCHKTPLAGGRHQWLIWCCLTCHRFCPLLLGTWQFLRDWGHLSSRTDTQHLQDQHLILRTQLLVQDSSMLSMRLGASLEESWSSVSVGFTLQRFFCRVQKMRDCSVCLGISLWKRADKSRLLCLKSKVILNLRLMS